MTIPREFWGNTEKVGDCWNWIGCKLPAGYGKIKVGGKLWLAHRWAFQLAGGTIPEGALVLHRCDNPSCVNPAHLFLGTAKENMADMLRKGRDAAKLYPEKWKAYGRRLGKSRARRREASGHV